MTPDAPAGTVQQELARAAHAPAPRTLLDVLAATAAAHPDATALEDPDGTLDYAALLRTVHERADDLARRGVRRGDRVGVRIPSGGRDLYLSILAVLAAGAAYVPVDADDPEERATLVFGEAGVVGVIGAGGVLRDRDGAELPVTDPAASAELPARPTTRGSSSPPVRRVCPRVWRSPTAVLRRSWTPRPGCSCRRRRSVRVTGCWRG